MQLAVAVADLQFLFFEFLFRQGLDHATAVEAVGRIVAVPYFIIKAEHLVIQGGVGIAGALGALRELRDLRLRKIAATYGAA